MMPTTVVRVPSTSIARPTTPGSPLNARCHSSCESRPTSGAFGRLSSSESERPRSGATPSALSRGAVTSPVVTRIGSVPASPRFDAWMLYAPTSSNARFRSRNSKYSGGEIQNLSYPSVGNWLVMNMSRSGSGYPSGFSTTPFTTLKIALFAPIPSASVSSATIVNPGVRSRPRSAYLRSVRMEVMRRGLGSKARTPDAYRVRRVGGWTACPVVSLSAPRREPVKQLEQPLEQVRAVLGDPLPERAAAEGGKLDLVRVLQIGAEDFLHLARERLVDDQRVRLVVERHRAVVGVERADRGPDAVDDQRLGVHHRRAVLEDPHARLQQLGVDRARGVAHRLDVGRRARGQDAHVHPAPRRRLQQAPEVVVGDEVGVGDVQPPPRAGDREHEEALGARAAHARHRVQQRHRRARGRRAVLAAAA